MSKYLMSMALVGLGLPACGEESKTSGGGEEGACTSVDADINDKDGDFWPYCGEVQNDCDDSDPRINPGAKEVADGKDNDCDGKVDGIPPGADSELCGDGRTCQDGFQCGAEAEKPDICTCPQWMEGTWWAEFTEVRRTDGEEYDFMAPGLDRQFWSEQEVTFEQDGCVIRGPDLQFLWARDDGSGELKLPSLSFSYKRTWDAGDNQEHSLQSTGQVSADGKSVQGTCTGEYPGWHTGRNLFPITCTFVLTRRE